MGPSQDLASFDLELEGQEGAGAGGLREGPLKPAKVVGIGFELLEVGAVPATADVTGPDPLLVVNEAHVLPTVHEGGVLPQQGLNLMARVVQDRVSNRRRGTHGGALELLEEAVAEREDIVGHDRPEGFQDGVGWE